MQHELSEASKQDKKEAPMTDYAWFTIQLLRQSQSTGGTLALGVPTVPVTGQEHKSQ